MLVLGLSWGWGRIDLVLVYGQGRIDLVLGWVALTWCHLGSDSA